MRDGRPARSALELAFYTDADIRGAEATAIRPYLFLIPRPDFMPLPRRLRVPHLGIVVRVDLHKQPKNPDVLGIRLRSGGISRIFDPDGDCRGYPICSNNRR